jgi:tetratricopeptide (TPR) repeat protein
LAALAATGLVAAAVASATGAVLFHGQRQEAETQRNAALQLAGDKEVLANAEINARRRAEEKQAEAQQHAANARRFSSMMMGLLRDSDPTGIYLSPTGDLDIGEGGELHISVAQFLDRASERAGIVFQEDPVGLSEVRGAVGETLKNMGDCDKAVPHLREALRIRRHLFGDEDSQAANIEFNLAWALAETPQGLPAAESHFRNVLDVRRRLGDQQGAALAEAALLFTLAEQSKTVTAIVSSLSQAFEDHPDRTLNPVKCAYYYFQSVQARREGRHEDAVRLLRGLLAEVAEFFGEDHLATAAAQAALAGELRDLGEFAEGRQLMSTALPTLRKSLDGNVRLAPVLNSYAWALREWADYETAVPLARESFALISPSLNKRNRAEWSTIILRHGQLLQEAGELREAANVYRQARRSPALLSDGAGLEMARRLAGVLYELGQYDDAAGVLRAQITAGQQGGELTELLIACQRELGAYASAHDLARQSLNSSISPPAPAEAQSDLRDLLRRHGRWTPDDEVSIRRSLSQHTIADHPARARDQVRLARKLVETGGYDEAVPLLESALTIQRARYGEQESPVCDVLLDLAVLRLCRKDFEQARAYAEEAVALCRGRHGDKHFATAATLHDAGRILDDAGFHTEAAGLLRQALAIRQLKLPVTSPRVWDLLSDLFATLDDPGERELLLREYATQVRGTLPFGTWRGAQLESQLGEALIEQGRFVEAEPLLQAAHANLLACFGPDHPLAKDAKRRLLRLDEERGKLQPDREPAPENKVDDLVP